MPRSRPGNVTDEQIVAAYDELHSVNKVAEYLGIGESTADRALKRYGVKRDGLDRYRASMRTVPWMGVYTGPTKEIVKLYERGWSLRKIAKKIDRSVHVVTRVLQQEGVAMRPWLASGPDHSCWTGGRLSAGKGYWRVWVPDDDPMATMRNSQGYVLEHRLVMARKLGRPLSRRESVHHIDGNPSNNAPGNLQLCFGSHGSGIALQCRCCGSPDIIGVPLVAHPIDPAAGDGASTSLFE